MMPKTAYPFSAAGGWRAAAARLAPRFLLGKALAAAGLGLALGYLSALAAISGVTPAGGLAVGPWRLTPGIGGRQADPYARAFLARTGRAPLAADEGLQMIAAEDSAGRPLQADCVYRVYGPYPAAQFWSLAPITPGGAALDDGAGPVALRSGQLLRAADGAAEIVVSRRIRAGNWLATPTTGRFLLLLTLYETSLEASGDAAPRAPTIERLSCG